MTISHGITRPMGADFDTVLNTAQSHQLDHIELYMLPPMTRDQFRQLRQHNIAFQIHEIPTNPLHSCFKFDKQELIDTTKHWIDLLHEFEGTQLIIHAPQWNYDSNPRVVDGLIDGIHAIYDYAQNHNVQLTLELLEGFYYSHFRYFEQQHGWQQLQLTYDFRRSPYRGRKTSPDIVFNDLQAFAHRISNFHTFYIGMGREVKGGVGEIPTAERTTNFKDILKMLKFMEWSGTITCENPHTEIAAQMAAKTRRMYNQATLD